MERIISISEAYSQEPNKIRVQSEEQAEIYYDKPNACKEIKMETILNGPPSFCEPFMAYVGYNFEGKKIFQYKCDSVNVHYGE